MRKGKRVRTGFSDCGNLNDEAVAHTNCHAFEAQLRVCSLWGVDAAIGVHPCEALVAVIVDCSTCMPQSSRIIVMEEGGQSAMHSMEGVMLCQEKNNIQAESEEYEPTSPRNCFWCSKNALHHLVSSCALVPMVNRKQWGVWGIVRMSNALLGWKFGACHSTVSCVVLNDSSVVYKSLQAAVLLAERRWQPSYDKCSHS